jgi:SAM-dependent methyltransferase
MSESVRCHYERHPYPHYPLLASVRACDTYALNLTALWTRFNGELPPESVRRILIAGCGSFSPYPFSVANPGSEITALDLSANSLRRARLHCLLHGHLNVRYQAGDLLDAAVAPGPFGLIDSYGVLHHLHDPLEGLKSLGARLAPGGILRVMVYNRYARREEESIRRAFRLMKIADTASARDVIRRSAPGSRLRAFCEASDETGFDAGLADALLHPCVHTFRIDELLDLIRQAGLELLRFAHYGALEHVADEVQRIRLLEGVRQSCGNFLFYLGHDTKKNCRDDEDGYIMLNPCLKRIVGPLHFGPVHLPARLGFENPPLGRHERSFLRSFRSPTTQSSIDPETRAKISIYKSSLFLLQYHS